MKTEKFINAVSRAFWRRIEPYKNDFKKELPENLPVEFESFMGTALSQLDNKILVWTDAPSEPSDNGYCLLELNDGSYALGYYNDMQKVFAVPSASYVYFGSIARWVKLNTSANTDC